MKIGETVGNYRVLRQIGAGGMSVVYEVEHVRLGTHCALKAFSLDGSDAPLMKKRFLAEGRLLARLNHPGIVRVHDMDVTDGVAWFTMDLVLSESGAPRTLADIPRDGSSDGVRLVGWYEDIRSALEAVHAAGVVHRDVKLENMLIGADGHVRLADFGISRIVDERLRKDVSVTLTMASADAQGRTIVGTAAYLPPEVRDGQPLTAASDLYSLGVSLFRLLTGMWYEPGPHAFDLLAPYDRRWQTVLSALLSVNPSERRMLPWRGGNSSRNWRNLFWLLSAVMALALLFAAHLAMKPNPSKVPSDKSVPTNASPDDTSPDDEFSIPASVK